MPPSLRFFPLSGRGIINRWVYFFVIFFSFVKFMHGTLRTAFPTKKYIDILRGFYL